MIDPPTVGLCNPADVLIVPRRCDDLFYKQSRVSDEAVAVEHLAKQLGLGELEPSLHVVPKPIANRYGLRGGERQGARPGEEDLGRQVDWLLLDHAPLPADAVYVIMIGGNDAIDAMQADAAACRGRSRPSAAIVTSAVGAIGSSVERLLDFGARRVVVANVPDLATLPAIRDANSRGDRLAALAAASAISVAFDRELDAALDRIEARGRWAAPTPPDIERFDLRAALAGVQLTFAARGGNATDACFDSEAYRDSAAAERVFHPACTPPTVGAAPRFAEFVFWYGSHPTGAAHAAIGEAMRALL